MPRQAPDPPNSARTDGARPVAPGSEALRWREGQGAPAPRPGDAVSAWLSPALARCLDTAGIHTLAHLVERINGTGRRWQVGIRAIGKGKAARIVAWLQAHQGHDGLRLGSHVAGQRGTLPAHERQAVSPTATAVAHPATAVAHPATAVAHPATAVARPATAVARPARAVAHPATAVSPRDTRTLPPELDGTSGLYRCPQAQCLLPVSNDHQAVQAWLHTKHGGSAAQHPAKNAVQNAAQNAAMNASLKPRRPEPGSSAEQGQAGLQALSNTQRAYRKEAERLLLWAARQQGKALSSLDQNDCLAYLAFLGDPQPRSVWCGTRARARGSPLWRPFEGPLSASAQRHAVTVLKNLHGFLVDQHYLVANPWTAIHVARPAGLKVDVGRSFSVAQWQFITAQVQALPATSAHQRLSVGLHLLYATGLRLSEVVAATVDQLRWVARPVSAPDGGPAQGWVLRVVGKAQRQREVPLPDALVDALGRYLVSRGLAADPRSAINQGAHLLGKASDAAARAPGLHSGPAFDPRQGIAATTFYDQIKRFFDDCAGLLHAQGDVQGAQRLARASTHWIRHSHASHAIAGGMPIRLAQQNLGHVSPATTAAYGPTVPAGRHG